MTPLKIFEALYSYQPKNVREHIAFSVGCCLPHLAADQALAKHMLQSDESFQQWLDEIPTTPFQHLGRILMVRELVSLLVFRNSETADDWEIKGDERKEIHESAKTLGYHELAAKLEDSISNVPQDGNYGLRCARILDHGTKK